MNRLANERSPYLLQHAGNPVDWYPWASEAFEKARAEDKPIFLSVGYSTCHWCHVMERESFENADVARVLNEHFVSIKVDREERPDVDRVYMTFVQATTGSGGWPMSVWLTPELKPFYGGTYFPPASKWGRPGFVDILQQIAHVWRVERAKVVESADQVTVQLRGTEQTKPAWSTPGADALRRTVAQFRQAFDPRYGGFGDAPKFPRPSELLFLLREHARTGDPDAREIVLATLRAMALGGMRDHIGGGFHRYSVDAAWRVPHFEKMLYDQAQLVLAYVEAAQVSGDRFYLSVADDTLAYVMREMTDESGGFYSAEDADSVPPDTSRAPDTSRSKDLLHSSDLGQGTDDLGQGTDDVGQGTDDVAQDFSPASHPHKAEGAFYLWTAEEVDALLGDDAVLVKKRYGIEAGGNAPFDPQQEFTGKNLLYVARAVDALARETGKSEAEIEEILARARLAMFRARGGRPRPHLDDKILTAWNGLMIAAFARTARVMQMLGPDGGPAAQPYIESAQRAATFIRDRLWTAGSGPLLRRFRDGHADIDAYAEDYAYLIFGLLELFQADPRPEWLNWAAALQRRQDELFWDEADGGWFSTTGRDPSVLLRMKEDYDGAEPTASSVSTLNLLTLSHLIDNPQWNERIERTLRLFATRLEQMGRAVPMMAAALSTHLAGPQQIVVVGENGSGELARLVGLRYLPFATVLAVSEGQIRALADTLPAVGAMGPVNGKPAAYVCRDFTCRQPATTVEQLREQLESS